MGREAKKCITRVGAMGREADNSVARALKRVQAHAADG